MHVRSNWSPFMDDDNCLSPGKIHQWLYQVVGHGFKALDGKDFRKRKLKLVMLSGQFPSIRVIMSCTTVSDGDDHDMFSVIYNIIPSIRAAGFPQGAYLQHPFPRQMPYSIQGQTLLKQLQKEIEDGDISFTLEFPPGKPGPGMGGRPFNPALTRRTAEIAEAKKEEERKIREQKWKLSLGQLDDMLLQRAMQTSSMRHAKTALEVFTAVQQSKGARWQVITPGVQASTMLWTMKKTAQKNRNASDWFVAYLKHMCKFLSTRFCPQFLQMNINAMTSADAEEVDEARNDVQELLDDINEDPTHLLKHYLHKQ